MLIETLANLCKNISERGSDIFYFSKDFQNCKVSNVSNMFVAKENEKFHIEIQLVLWKNYSILKTDGKTFLIFRSDIFQFSNLEFDKDGNSHSKDCVDAAIQIEISLFKSNVDGENVDIIDYQFFIVDVDYEDKNKSLSNGSRVVWISNSPHLQYVL